MAGPSVRRHGGSIGMRVAGGMEETGVMRGGA